MQRVAREQPPGRMSAELPQFEGATAVEIGRDIQPACKQDIAAHAPARNAAERQRLSGHDIERRVARYRIAVEPGPEIRPGKTQARGRIEAQRWPGEGHLEPRRALRIAQPQIAQPERAVIHRPGRRDPDRP